MKKKTQKRAKLTGWAQFDKWPLGRKVEEVIWLDHSSGSNWLKIEQIKETMSPLVCRTAGFVVAEDEQVITITHTQCGSNGDIHGGITIIKRLIVSRKLLRKG